MKPFLMAVIACIAITVGAAYVMRGLDGAKYPGPVAGDVRVH